MLRGIGMKRDVGGPCLGKHLNQRIDGLHHQMHIDRRGHTVIAERLAYHGPHCEVRHIVIIHNIEMHHVGTSREHSVDLFAQTRKVSCQNGGRNEVVRHEVGAPESSKLVVYWLAESEGNRWLSAVRRSGVPTSSHIPS